MRLWKNANLISQLFEHSAARRHGHQTWSGVTARFYLGMSFQRLTLESIDGHCNAAPPSTIDIRTGLVRQASAQHTATIKRGRLDGC